MPLASLASCVSDREEDRLKQRIVAVTEDNTECVSPVGHYRFVQTRNLNAFLMWIERAPEHAAGDRCVELHRALDCLKRHGAKEA